MNNSYAISKVFFFPVVLMALLISGISQVVHAQPLFALECADQAQEMVGEGEPFDAEALLRMMAETGRLTYEGEEPIKGRIFVFFLGEEGEPQGSIATDSFEMEPGTRPIGKLVPGDQFAEQFEAFVPGDQFFPEAVFTMGPTSVSLSSDSEGEFDELKVEWSRLRERVGEQQVGIGFAFLPIDKDQVHEEKIRLRTTGIVGSVGR